MRALVYRSGVRRKRTVPDEMREALVRRGFEALGFALIALVALAAVALLGWSAQDPSFNNAVDGDVRNFLGRPGAFVADMLMQGLGLASLVFLFPAAAWGWRLLFRRPLDREKMRLLAWMAAIICAAFAAAAIPETASWPLPTGLGGFVGDSLARSFGVLVPATGHAATAIAAAIGAMGTFFTIVAAGFGFRDDMPELTRLQRRLPAVVDEDEEEEPEEEEEEEDEDEEAAEEEEIRPRRRMVEFEEEERGFAFAPFGLIVHYWLALKSGLARMLRGGAFVHTERDAGRVGMRDLLRRLDEEGYEVDRDEDEDYDEEEDEDAEEEEEEG